MSGEMRSAERFVHANTAVAAAPLVPEISLHLATEVTPLWQATESELARSGLEPPFWAFAWPGGQALARHVLDHPELVRGRRVLDIAAGCGIAAIAAARAGAAEVIANEIDDFAAAALALNAGINRAAVEISRRDLLGDGGSDGFDLILAGDVCYERPMADRVIPWLRSLAGAGVTILMGDPGRAYLPAQGLVEVASYDVPTSRELEDRELRVTRVLRLMP